MKQFLKSNKIISGFFGISILVSFLYILSLDKKEWFPHAGDWFNLLFQLSVGFIINFIFYVTQVYIPQYKQKMEASRCIEIRIAGIVCHMREIFSHLGSKYMGHYDEDDISDSYMFELLRKMNINDRIGVLNARRTYSSNVSDEMHFTVKEWIITRIELVESEIDKLMKYYAPYINTELMKTLESILKSAMHQTMARSLLQLPAGISFGESNDDIFLKPYFDLMKELETIEKQYKQQTQK